jgi:hypothetical protein
VAWRAASEAGIARVERYYTDDLMFGRYRVVYEEPLLVAKEALMAGIGFELRRLLRKNTLVGLIEAYAYAGIIGSGPWVFSIVGILLIGFFSASVVVPNHLVTQFQTSVTYLVASSLILTGLLQLAFTRFVSDRLFEKKKAMILPNLHGLLLLVSSLPPAPSARSPCSCCSLASACSTACSCCRLRG